MFLHLLIDPVNLLRDQLDHFVADLSLRDQFLFHIGIAGHFIGFLVIVDEVACFLVRFHTLL